ncbi:MAG: hypothetical protein AB4426_24010 [Xenococcaceae cyanobacterium]
MARTVILDHHSTGVSVPKLQTVQTVEKRRYNRKNNGEVAIAD